MLTILFFTNQIALKEDTSGLWWPCRLIDETPETVTGEILFQPPKEEAVELTVTKSKARPPIQPYWTDF